MTVFWCLVLAAAVADQDHDGFPDVCELTRAADRWSFRQRFAAAALAACAQPDDDLRDCGDLARFAMREALKSGRAARHVRDGRQWTGGEAGALPYAYPDVPVLGARIFQGPDSFSVYASTRELMLYNTVFRGKTHDDLETGDLLFYVRSAHEYHVMIYLDLPDGEYLVYHTGPGADGRGELRLIRFATLARLEDAAWRPEPSNAAFAGFYRWRILD